MARSFVQYLAVYNAKKLHKNWFKLEQKINSPKLAKTYKHLSNLVTLVCLNKNVEEYKINPPPKIGQIIFKISQICSLWSKEMFKDVDARLFLAYLKLFLNH